MKSLVNLASKYSGGARYFDETPLWSAPFGLKLLEFVKYERGITALDIGCGTGFPLIELAMRLGANSKVYGIDPWRDAMLVAREKASAYGVENLQLIEGSIESSTFEDSMFNLITSNNGLNNVDDYEAAIKECARIIKPGGQIIQTMNLDKTMFEFYHVYEDVLMSNGMLAEIELMREHIKRKRPPVENVISVMRRNGFEIIEIEYDQFNYRFADGTAFLNHHFIRMAFLDSWIKLLPEDQIENVFNKIESKLNQKARRDGFLKLSVPFALINASFKS